MDPGGGQRPLQLVWGLGQSVEASHACNERPCYPVWFLAGCYKYADAWQQIQGSKSNACDSHDSLSEFYVEKFEKGSSEQVSQSHLKLSRPRYFCRKAHNHKNFRLAFPVAVTFVSFSEKPKAESESESANRRCC
ncbi:hypothetical protein ACLKA6_011616 [Drosophila palustris]